jgi:hypothetical protein
MHSKRRGGHEIGPGLDKDRSIRSLHGNNEEAAPSALRGGPGQSTQATTGAGMFVHASLVTSLRAGELPNHLLQIRVNYVDQLFGRKRALCVWLP